MFFSSAQSPDGKSLEENYSELCTALIGMALGNRLICGNREIEDAVWFIPVFPSLGIMLYAETYPLCVEIAQFTNTH